MIGGVLDTTTLFVVAAARRVFVAVVRTLVETLAVGVACCDPGARPLMLRPVVVVVSALPPPVPKRRKVVILLVVAVVVLLLPEGGLLQRTAAAVEVSTLAAAEKKAWRIVLIQQRSPRRVVRSPLPAPSPPYRQQRQRRDRKWTRRTRTSRRRRPRCRWYRERLPRQRPAAGGEGRWRRVPEDRFLRPTFPGGKGQGCRGVCGGRYLEIGRAHV